MFRFLIFALLVAASLPGQEILTLRDSVRQALAAHPSQQAAAALADAAQARVEQARTGFLPKATYSETFQTSNQPVFAFGSLLNQRRFSEQNFAIDALNHPGFVNNFQSQIRVDQTVWDFGATRSGIRSAEIAREMSGEERRFAAQQRVAAVARAYHAVTLAQRARAVAEAAVKSAEADLARAEAVRDAGMSTDADVLSLRVHAAAMREQEIRRRYDSEVALAALNEAMGAPLDTARQLATPLTAVTNVAVAEGTRPEVRQAQLAVGLREQQQVSATRGYYPQIFAQGVFEANRGKFVTQGGANWFFVGGLRWTLFDGATKRKVEEAAHATAVAEAQQRQVSAQVALQVRQAQAQVAAAQERLAVTEAAVAESEESVRITRNRYEAGLARVNELLRSELAVMDAQMRRLQAIYDQRLAAVEVELAAGTLTEDSHVLD